MCMDKKIADSVFYVGVNDRRTHLFENMWPLPYGVSYNSFLIDDEKIALIDTVDVGKVEAFLKKIEAVLKGRTIDYLVINHMEPDHGGSIRFILERYPDIQIVGNKKTFGMIEGYFELQVNQILVKEGDSLNLGAHTLHFYMAPMVHWPEVMTTYESKEKILFSADAFGTYGALNGGVLDSELNLDHFWGEMRRYYSNIVGKYGNPVQKVIQKLSNMEIKTICSTHGPVWQENIDKVVEMYDQMSKYESEEGAVVCYGSMYGNTEEMAEVVARGLSDGGIKNIAMHDVSKSHSSDIISDVFRYKGFVVGSPTYSNELYPGVKSILDKIITRGVKDRYLSYFGSHTWASATNKYFAKFAEEVNWEVVGEPVEEKMALKHEKQKACYDLGRAMAARLKDK